MVMRPGATSMRRVLLVKPAESRASCSKTMSWRPEGTPSRRNRPPASVMSLIEVPLMYTRALSRGAFNRLS